MSARPHFSIAGIPIRIEGAFLVIAGLFGLRYIDENVLLLPIWMATTFVSILVHELGHGVALRVFGIRPAIVLHGFGGVTLSRGCLSRTRSIIVSLAGSLTALAFLWWPARTLLGTPWANEQLLDYALSGGESINWWRPLQFLAFQNLWWSIANLLPIRPLDGGNVTAELFGLHAARRISIAVAIAGALFAFANDQTYAALFALFLAFSNYREIREEQAGHEVNAFEVDPPEVTGRPGTPRRRGRGRRHLHAAPPLPAGPAGPPTLTAPDPARTEQQAWQALRSGDAATAARLVERLGPASVNPYLRASVALATGDASAFERFEAAYVAEPGGPPSMVATELIARAGAAGAVAKRLVARPDGAGRDGAGTLQTHLHYADRFREAAEVGEVVYGAQPPSAAQTAFEVACSWARAGEVDRAAAWLDRAADAGFRAAGIVDGEPDLASVREHPSWPVLRARLV